MVEAGIVCRMTGRITAALLHNPSVDGELALKMLHGPRLHHSQIDRSVVGWVL
jgi:hypothetical protein